MKCYQISHMNDTHIINSSKCSRHVSALSFGNYLAKADLGWVSLVCAHLVPCVNIIISTAINMQKKKNHSFSRLLTVLLNSDSHLASFGSGFICAGLFAGLKKLHSTKVLTLTGLCSLKPVVTGWGPCCGTLALGHWVVGFFFYFSLLTSINQTHVETVWEHIYATVQGFTYCPRPGNMRSNHIYIHLKKQTVSL